MNATLNLDLLWQRRNWIILSTITAVTLGLGYLLVADRTYEVESRVLIENRGLSATGGLENATRYREFLATQGEVLSSERIVGPVVQTTDLWKTLSSDEQAGLIRKALKEFEVATVVNTDVLRLRYRGEDPDFAIQLVSGILAKYQSYIREVDKDHLDDMLATLSKSEQELRAELAEKGEALAERRSRNGLVGTGRDMVHVQLSSLNRLSERLAETRRGRVELQIKLGSLKRDRSTPNSVDRIAFVSREVGIQSEPASYPRLRNRATNEPTEARGAYEVVRTEWEAKASFKQVSQKYGPKHPEFQAAKERAEKWTQYTEQHNSSLVAMLENELNSTREAEAELQAMVDEEYQRIKEFDKDLLGEQQLASEIERIESAHAIAIERLRDYKLTDEHIEKGKSSTKIVVLNPPVQPEEPIWPQPFLFLAVSALFGATLSSLAAMYLQ